MSMLPTKLEVEALNKAADEETKATVQGLVGPGVRVEVRRKKGKVARIEVSGYNQATGQTGGGTP